MSYENYQIKLVGLSNNQIKNLPDGILGISRTTNMEELAQIYSESTVLVNPTYSDNFPTTNIEALACGTPGPQVACHQAATQARGCSGHSQVCSQQFRGVPER